MVVSVSPSPHASCADLMGNNTQECGTIECTILEILSCSCVPVIWYPSPQWGYPTLPSIPTSQFYRGSPPKSQPPHLLFMGGGLAGVRQRGGIHTHHLTCLLLQSCVFGCGCLATDCVGMLVVVTGVFEGWSVSTTTLLGFPIGYV